MKKILALVLCLMMAFCSCAFATEENALVFDSALVEAIGLEGEFAAIEDFGLMFYCPANFAMYEVTEEQAAAGVYATFAPEDLSFGMTLTYNMVQDGNGNIITDLESLTATYIASGFADATICTVNGLPAVTYSMPDAGLMALAFMMENGAVLSFQIVPVLDEATLNTAYAIMSSIMPIQYA